ncbi:hypothetical protein [Flavobacterium soli]|uniref:hypothetical protein n=1 Tax=Flavobacterium soli TaxID=344881 RepID=UPI000411835D|nr:hypothetical protein [Flavobacterium soli]
MIFLIPLILIWFFFFRKDDPRDDPAYYQQGSGSYTTPPAGAGSTTTNPDGSITVKSTISQAKAEAIARQLDEELFAITSDSKILSLFKGLNEADFIMIDKSFGYVRSGIGGFGEALSLVEYLIKDCSVSTIQKLAKQFPSFF